MTVAELLAGGDINIPKADLAWKYEPGKTLVRPEEIQNLPTQMRRLHAWYMDAIKKNRQYLLLKVPPEYYFTNHQSISIELT